MIFCVACVSCLVGLILHFGMGGLLLQGPRGVKPNDIPFMIVFVACVSCLLGLILHLLGMSAIVEGFLENKFLIC